jgi:YbbR domain-containing protein
MAWYPLRNPGLKAAALGLGTLLWMTVSGQQVERSVLVQLQFRNLPSNMQITGDPPRTVDVRVSGAAGLISRLEPTEIVATVDVTGSRPGTRVFPLTVDQVTVPLGVEVKSVDPPTISLVLEVTKTDTAMVQPTIDGEPAAGYEVEGVDVVPKIVVIVGPESHLKQHQTAQTESISIDGATSSVVETVSMAVRDPAVRLRDPQQARVTIRIVKRMRQ